MTDTATTIRFLDRQLRLFERRCTDGFIDGVAIAYRAAVWSGLTDNVGYDAVQTVIARALRHHDGGGRP
jgi:hypothetical protein